MEIKNRSGRTAVTSVSVSKEFEGLIHKYGISPTEAFRKGMAVELYERGVGHYLTNKNQERSEQIQTLLKSLKEWGEIAKEIESKKQIIAQIQELIKKGESK